MKKILIFFLLVCVLICNIPSNESNKTENDSTINNGPIYKSNLLNYTKDFDDVNINSGSFIRNLGQISNEDVLFYTNNAYFMKNKIVFRIINTSIESNIRYANDIILNYNIYSVVFLGANNNRLEGEIEDSSTLNYFFGNPENWIRNVPHYNSIVFRNIYDDIDMRYIQNVNGLKYEFIVKPGGNPNDIKMNYEGADLNTNGKDLFISCGDMTITDGGLYIYQNHENRKEEISGFINICNNIVTYDIAYDPNYELVIDPIIFSTYLGGGSSECSNSITNDQNGNIIVAGHTFSSDFPTTPGAYCEDDPSNFRYDGFVTKMNNDASQIIVSTYIGGDGNDHAKKVFIDTNGDFIITGSTDASSFPTTTELDWTNSNNPGYFISKFDSSVSNLLFSAIFLNSDQGNVYGYEIDSENSLYFTGSTNNHDFPVTRNAYSDMLHGDYSAFIMKIASNYTHISYSTFFGGHGTDRGSSIALTNPNWVSICGETTSPDLQVTSTGISQSYNGGVDSFLSCIEISTNTLEYSTYIGGSNRDSGEILKSSEYKNFITLVGLTHSTDFPVTPNALFDNFSGFDSFIMQFDLNEKTLNYSSSFGYTNCGGVFSRNNEIHVSGWTFGDDFPTTNDAIKTTREGLCDLFYSIIDIGIGESSLSYSTLIGGSDGEWVRDMILDTNGNTLLTGNVKSSNFPTTEDVIQNSKNGDHDAFVLSFNYQQVPGIPLNPVLCPGDGFINFSWDPPLNDGGIPIISYNVYKGVSEDSIEFIDNIEDIFYFNDSDVINGNDYYYQVSAINAFGEGYRTPIMTSAAVGKPSEPLNFFAVEEMNLINLFWTQPTSTGGFPITNYNIYKCEVGGTFSLYRVIENETKYVDMNVKKGVFYRYAVSAINEIGEGDVSLIIEVAPGSIPGSIPLIEIYPGDGLIELEWMEPDNRGFEILFYNVLKGVNEEELEIIGSTSCTSFVDNNVTNGFQYYYSINAVNLKGESTNNPIVSGMPSGLPGKVMVDGEAGDSYNHISWFEPFDNGGLDILKYNLYRGYSNDSLSLEISLTVNEYSDYQLENGVPYFYSVAAVNANGEGNKSSPIMLIPTSVPEAPVEIIIQNYENKILLTWKSPVNSGGLEIVEYNIYKGKSEGDFSLIKRVNNTEYVDLDFYWGTKYFYSVSATNDEGESERSSIVTIVPITTPGKTTIFVEVKSIDFIKIGWDEPLFTGGDSQVTYHIYRGVSFENLNFLYDTDSLIFNDTNLIENHTYFYGMKCINSAGEGELSDVAEVTTLENLTNNGQNDTAIETRDEISILIIIITIFLFILITSVLISSGIVVLRRKGSVLSPHQNTPHMDFIQNKTLNGAIKNHEQNLIFDPNQLPQQRIPDVSSQYIHTDVVELIQPNLHNK